MSGPGTLDATDVVYFDGDVPIPQDVTALRTSEDGTELEIETGDRVIRWPLADIRALQDMAGGGASVLRLRSDPLARLCRPSPFSTSALPHPFRPAPPKGRGRLAAWALAAVAAVALQIGVLIPLLADNLAGFIPPEGERALGEATFGQIREALDETGIGEVPICENPDGSAALATLTETLMAGQDTRHEVQVFVLDHSLINAFALPGGYVVLFDGLIKAADDPDQVAAVLAHEIGHVASRDPTRHALRSAGSIGVLGLIFGDFAGGAAVLFLAERLISAQYSQEAEAGADAFAHDMLEEAGISPGALGDMFDHMRRKHGDEDGLAAHFLSHPRLGDRISAAQARIDAAADYRASLSDQAWQDLRRICD